VTITDATARQEAEALAFSRPLDVHRWSDYPDADAFVDEVYARCQQGKRTAIERKHFKVVLLDLYVAWLEHSNLKLSVSRQPAAYKAKGSRYNALHISRKTIDVVDLLHGAGLIEMKMGFYERERRQGKQTRIWPTPGLIALFNRSKLDAYNVGRAADEEVIFLRNENGDNIEYEDTPEIDRMRKVVRDYNELLSRHFIDIRRLDKPWIDLSDGSRLMLGPSRQRVYRVFNRSTFDNGGRFFGPWWQQCPKPWRREIFIDDAPTIEQDYSSLHIALLYARRGVNYYKEREGDAYQIDTPSFLSTPEQTRQYAKRLLLTAVNAKSDKATFKAFRSDCNDDEDKVGGRLTDKQLSILLDGLRQKHPRIADDLASDAGIELMNEDSRITEHVIKRFTERRLPVLTIHDSYIVNWSYDDLLQQALKEAFSIVTGMTGIRSERMGVAWADEASWETQRLEQDALTRSEGYVTRLLNWMVNAKEHMQVPEGIGQQVNLVDRAYTTPSSS
jgi:hypothetical protein